MELLAQAGMVFHVLFLLFCVIFFFGLSARAFFRRSWSKHEDRLTRRLLIAGMVCASVNLSLFILQSVLQVIARETTLSFGFWSSLYDELVTEMVVWAPSLALAVVSWTSGLWFLRSREDRQAYHGLAYASLLAGCMSWLMWSGIRSGLWALL